MSIKKNKNVLGKMKPEQKENVSWRVTLGC